MTVSGWPTETLNLWKPAPNLTKKLGTKGTSHPAETLDPQQLKQRCDDSRRSATTALQSLALSNKRTWESSGAPAHRSGLSRYVASKKGRSGSHQCS